MSLVGVVEYARITEDDGYLGSGIGGAAGLELHLTTATSLELEIGREQHVRDLALYAVAYDAQGRPEPLPFTERWEGAATFVMGLVSHAFGAARVRPAIWGGGGLMSHGGTTRGPLVMPQVPPGLMLQAGDIGMRRGRPTRALAMEGGSGVDVRVTDRLAIRPWVGLRLVGTGNVGPKYVVRSGARAAFRW